jgi:hypothetical protein
MDYSSLRLNTTLENPSSDAAEELVPDGWVSLWAVILRLTGYIDNCTLVKMGIEKGLLRTEFKCENQTDQNLLNLISNSIARESTLKCMVCGKWGRRRKLEEGMPCLCGHHYTEYVNYLDQRNNDGFQV